MLQNTNVSYRKTCPSGDPRVNTPIYEESIADRDMPDGDLRTLQLSAQSSIGTKQGEKKTPTNTREEP